MNITYKKVFSKGYKRKSKDVLVIEMENDLLMNTVNMNNFLVRRVVETEYDIREQVMYHVGRLTIYGED